MKGKRCLGTFMALCVSVGGFTGCGNTEQQPVAEKSSEEALNSEAGYEDKAGDLSTDWEEDPAEVNWIMWQVGGSISQEGIQKVEDAVNEITLNKINVKVNLEILEMGNYMTQMSLRVSSGDKVDLISTFPAGSGTFLTMVNNGQLLPLDSLLEEYGKEMLEILPDQYLEATTFEGSIYGIPFMSDRTTNMYWLCHKSILEEAGISGSDIKNWKDIENVLAKVHEVRPDIKGISTMTHTLLGTAGAMFTGVTYDTLATDCLAVFTDKEGEETKVQCLYETDEYKECIQVLNDWYEKGYIDKDAALKEDSLWSDASIFSGYLDGNQTRIYSSEALAGEELVAVKLCEGIVTTENMVRITMAIPVSATEPEGAMRLMSLCYTDAELKNLVSFGIEGENYTLNSDGSLTTDYSNNAYAPNTKAIFGNQMLCYPTPDEIESGYDMALVDQDTLNYSPLLGFSINTENISSEIAAITNVINEYRPALECGMASEEDYNTFIDKLYDSGMQKYLDEVQNQIDEWLENK